MGISEVFINFIYYHNDTTHIFKLFKRLKSYMMRVLLILIFLFQGFCNAQSVWDLRPTDFFKLPEGKNFGETVGLAVNSHNHVFVCHRGPENVMEFDETGNFIRTIGSGLILNPHGLRIDSQDNIWITDVGQHLVFRFNPEGQITLILGKVNAAGEWNKTYNTPLFNRPADIAFDSDNNIYIADGYGNSRVVKLDRNGNFLKTWGIKGTGPGEFNLVHNIVIDSKNIVYVIDRENKRIQLFDKDGEYLREWNNLGNPYGIVINKNDLYVTDGITGLILKVDQSGRIIARYGQQGKAVGQFLMPHAITVSDNNILFIADTNNWRVQCFRIPPDAK